MLDYEKTTKLSNKAVGEGNCVGDVLTVWRFEIFKTSALIDIKFVMRLRARTHTHIFSVMENALSFKRFIFILTLIIVQRFATAFPNWQLFTGRHIWFASS